MIKVITGALAVLVIVVVVVFLLSVGSIMMGPVLVPLGLPLPGGCIRQTDQRVLDIRGLEFEVADVDCGLFGSVHWRELRVRYLSKVTRTEIFRYMGDRSPTIKAIDRRTILVAIESVEAIGLQKYTWRDWTIRYDIRSIERPNHDRMRVDER